MSKKICTFLVFLDEKSGYLKFCKNFCIFEMAWSRAFQKCILKFVCQHFYYITGYCDKKFNFSKFAIFFAYSKSRAQELSNDVSFVIFGHQTWNLVYPGFQVPQQR